MVDVDTGKEYEYWTTSARLMVVGWVYQLTAQVFYDEKNGAWFLRNARGIKLVEDGGFSERFYAKQEKEEKTGVDEYEEMYCNACGGTACIC